jgi:hypothetical protein
MKARLVVLVVAAACAAAGATAHVGRAQGPVGSSATRQAPAQTDALLNPSGGWWDFDGSDRT